jgi:hypothetical protein
MRVEDFDCQEIASWTRNVSAVLHAIRPLAKGRRASLALKLAEHAIERIAYAMDKIDQYDFRFYNLIGRAQRMHLAAAKVARPDPFELARSLSALDRSTAGYKISDFSFQAYAQVLGTAGLAHYRRLTEEAWAELPPRTPNTTDGPVPGVYYHLNRTLDRFAESDGDVDARIELRTKYLPSTVEWVKLVEFCLQQGRPDTALEHAEKGLTALAGVHHVKLARLTARLLLERGRKAEAQLRLRNGFNTAEFRYRLDPIEVRELCVDLCAFGEPARDWLIARLEAKIEAADKKSRVHFADILLDILLDEEMLEVACNTARKFPCSLDAKERVAKKAVEALPTRAIELYEELVRLRLAKGSWPHFSKALDMLWQLAELQTVDEHQSYVRRLKDRFAHKLDVMKVLDRALGTA